MAPHLYKRPVSIPRGLQVSTYEEAAAYGRQMPIDYGAAGQRVNAAVSA